MKANILLVCGLFLLIFPCRIFSNNQDSARDNPLTGSVQVFSVSELYQLTASWAFEFNKLHPGIDVRVTKVGDDQIEEMTGKGDQIAFITGNDPARVPNDQAWRIVVGREVIVPVINRANPFMEQLTISGVAPARLARTFKDPSSQNWASLINKGGFGPVEIYVVNEPAVTTVLAGFIRASSLDGTKIKLVSADEMKEALKKDIRALGFCRLSQIMESGEQSFTEPLRLLPLDKNGNGKLDFMEDIYENPTDFSRGVWIGKYPKSLCNEIFAISGSRPGGGIEVAFLNWVLDQGQDRLTINGYSELVGNERQTQLDKVNVVKAIEPGATTGGSAWIKWILLVIVGVVLAGWFVSHFYYRADFRKVDKKETVSGAYSHFDEKTVILPGGLFFDKTHTWTFLEQDGTVKIGLDDFLQHVTGRITRVDMKNPGDVLVKGEKLLSIIQNGKQLDIYAPISGKILTRNQELLTQASLVNISPYHQGWIYRIEPANWIRDIQFLSMAEKYRIWLAGEFTRLKEFLAEAFKIHFSETALTVLQDGGQLKDRILADLGPEIWEEFQVKFIDKSR